jgi:transcription termination factor Rho
LTTETIITLDSLKEKTDKQLVRLAKKLGVRNIFEEGSEEMIEREGLISKIVKASESDQEQEELEAGGILDVMNDGYGFLRQNGMASPGKKDVYVSQSQIRRFSLRTGDLVTGIVRPPKDGEKYFGLIRVDKVNETDPDKAKKRLAYEKLTPVFPNVQITLETEPKRLSTRVIDMIAPIGMGQRGLVVSPPKAGKTMLLKDIANGITENHKNMHLIVALIGERPEEVTDVRRSVAGEVFASTFDEPVEDHCRVAELALERAKRLVEFGLDVTILMDSITRLTRAYNLSLPSSGRTLSGGIDPVALYPPKRFFGAARNTEDSGSLTIIATCLVETGSRMDDVIYEEFKGTGNWELHLDRRLAERRIYPAIDIQRSGTRREELILEETALKKIWLLRRMVGLITANAQDSIDATGEILKRMSETKSNTDFLDGLNNPSKK